jgi:hypothetical protein
VVTIASGRVRVEAVALARTRLIETDVRVDGAGTERAVMAAIDSALAAYGNTDYIRIRLQGAVAPGTRIDRDLLAERCGTQFAALEVIDRTFAADYADLARQPNVRGHVVRDLLERTRTGDDPDAERALRYVVAAFEAEEIAP